MHLYAPNNYADEKHLKSSPLKAKTILRENISSGIFQSMLKNAQLTRKKLASIKTNEVAIIMQIEQN